MNENRLLLFRDTLSQQGLSAFYVRNESDIRWMTGFDGVFDGEGAFALLVSPDQALLHTDSRYALATNAAAAGSPFAVSVEPVSHAAFAVRALGQQDDTSGVNVGIETSLTLGEYRQLQREAAKAAGQAPEQGTERAAVAADAPAAADATPTHASASVATAAPPTPSPATAAPASAPATGISFVETEGLCVNLRAVKDASEIARMRAAQAITDAAFAHIVGYMRPGMTERQVQVELEDFMVRHGASGLAFTSIVACGAHGASPHAVSDDTRLEAGQCVVLDFGARAQGYCSDMTRVVFLGEPSAAMRHAYAVLREANETVEAMLLPGVTGAQAHAKAEEILAAGGFAGKMGHGLGHGVGIDIHEQPNLSPRNEKPLVAGNVVTVEPGIYLEGEFGMRLEDFGVITERGFQVFTQSSHEMVII